MAGSPKKILNERQRAFVTEYMMDGRGEAAALRAGYSSKTAASQASSLLSNPKVRDFLAAAQAARAVTVAIKADNVLRELGHIGFSDIGDAFDVDGKLKPLREMKREVRTMISSVKTREVLEGAGDNAKIVRITEVKLWDKVAALDKLAKHLGLLHDGIGDTINNYNFAKMSDLELDAFIQAAIKDGILRIEQKQGKVIEYEPAE